MIGVFIQLNENSNRGKSNPIGYVICENGCWEWVGSLTTKGYGQWGSSRAHRVIYEMHNGPIPEGLQIDHLCRNPKCVNPDHLEAVRGRENTLRGVGPTATNAKKTHCKWGHALAGRNLRREGTHRKCRTCANLKDERRRRAAANRLFLATREGSK